MSVAEFDILCFGKLHPTMECDVSPVPSVQANRPTKQQQHIGTVVVTAAPAAKATANNGNSTSSGTASSTTLITSTTTGTTGNIAVTATSTVDTVEESAMEPSTTTAEDDAMPSSSVPVVAGPMRTMEGDINDRKSNNSNNNNRKTHSLAGSSSSSEAPVAVIEISDHSTADDISYPELVSCVDSDMNCVVLSDEYDTSLPTSKEDDPLNISTGSIEMLSSSQCSTPVPSATSASIVTEANTSKQTRIATPTNTPKHNHHLRRNLPRLATSRQQASVKQPQSGAGSRGGVASTSEKRQLRQAATEGSNSVGGGGGAASTMREVLASIPGFSIKPRRRTNKKLSTAAQLEQTREGCVDLETPDSILVHTNLRALLNRETFQLLPPLYQYKLVQLLPPVDRPPLPDATQCERNGIRLNPSGLNNEFFARACHEWRDRLAEGEFTPEAQLKMRSEAEREKSKLDPWKLKHFEPMWGDRKYAGSFFGAAGTVANPTPPTPPPAPEPMPTALSSGAPVVTASSQIPVVEVAPAQQSAPVPQTPLATSTVTPSVSIVPMSRSVGSGNATIVTVARQTQPPVAAVAAHPPRVHPVTAKVDPSSRSIGKMQAITFSASSGIRPANVASSSGSCSSNSISSNTIITSSTGTIILPSRTTITVTSGNASKHSASGSGGMLRGNGGTGAGVVGGTNSGLTVVPINILTGGGTSSSVGSSSVNTNRPALKTTIKLRPTTAIATSTTAAAPIGDGSKQHPYSVSPSTTNASVVIGTATMGVGGTKRIMPSAMSVSSSSSSTAISSTNSVDLSCTTTSMNLPNSGSLPMSPKRLRTVGAVTRSALAGSGSPQLPPPQHNPLPTTTTTAMAAGSTIKLGSRPVVVKVVEPYRPSAMVRAVPVDPVIAGAGAGANLKRTHSSRALTPELSSNKISKRKVDDNDGVSGVKGQRQVECDTRKTPIDGRMVLLDGAANEKRRRGIANEAVPPVAAVVGPSKRRAPRQGHKANRNRTSGGLLTSSTNPTTTITIVDDDVDGSSGILGLEEEENSQEIAEGGAQNSEALRRRIPIGPMVNGDVDEVDRIGRNSSPSLVPSSDIILEEAIDCGDVADSGELQEQQLAAGNRLKGDSVDTSSSPMMQETIEQQNLNSRERVMNLNHLHTISDSGGTTQMIYDQNTGQVYSVMCLPQPGNSAHGTGGLSLRSLPSSLTVTALPQHQQQHPPQQQPQLSISNDSSNSSSVSTTAMMAASDNHLDGGAGGGAGAGCTGPGVSTFENVLRQNVVDGGVGSDMVIINSQHTVHPVDNSVEVGEAIGMKQEREDDGEDDGEEEEEEDDEGDGEQVHTTTTTTNTADEEEEEEDEEEEEEDVGEEAEEENGEDDPEGHLEHEMIRQGLQMHDDLDVHCEDEENNTPGECFNGELIRTAADVAIDSKLGSYGQANLQQLQLHPQHHNNHLHGHHRHQAAASGGMMNMNLTGYHHDHELLHQQQQQLQQLQHNATTSSPSGSSEQGLMMMVTTTADGSEDPAGLSSNSGDVMVMASNYCDNLSAADEADGEDDEEEEEDEDEQDDVLGVGRELHEDEEQRDDQDHHHDRLLLDAGSIGIGMEEEAVGTIVDQYGNHHHPTHLNHHGVVVPQDGSEEEEDVEEANFVLDQMQQLQQQFHLAGGQNQHQQQDLLHNHQSLVTSSGGIGADGTQMHLFSGAGAMLLEGGDGLLADSQHVVEHSHDHGMIIMDQLDAVEQDDQPTRTDMDLDVRRESAMFDDQYAAHDIGPTVEVVDDIRQKVNDSDDDGKEILDERQISDPIEETYDEHAMIHSEQHANVSHHSMRSLMVASDVNVTTQSMESSYSATISSNSSCSSSMPVLATKRTTILVVEDCIATNGLHSPYEPGRLARRRSLNGVENVPPSVSMVKFGPRASAHTDAQHLERKFRGEDTGAPDVHDEGGGNEHKNAHVEAVEEVLPSSCGDWPQFKMEMMDTTKMMVVAGNDGHHQLIKDGMRNSMLKTEPGVSYTTIRQGNQLVTRIKLESDDSQLQSQAQQQSPQSFQAQLGKVNVVTSSPHISLGPNSQDNLTRVIESVAGNYSAVAVSGQQIGTSPQQQQPQQQIVTHQQPQQLIQHVQTASGHQLRYEMDPTVMQQQQQSSSQPHLIAQQQQPKFIITSRPLGAVPATVGANVIVGATNINRTKRSNDATSGTIGTITAGNGTTGNGNGGNSSSGSGSSSGGSKRGGRSSSSRLPPGAVNLERSYQICQAVSRLVNSKRTVSAGGRPHSSIVVRQVYTGGAAGAATGSTVANTAGTAASQSNPISIITATQSQHQHIHSLGEQLQQHGQIISVSAAPTIVHATAASNNNGTNGGNVNAGTGGSPVGTGNFGGKYLLVQRAAHIGEIVTPRAASAPPTHNQIRIPEDLDVDSKGFVITYGQDAHLIDPTVAAGSNTDSGDTEGGTTEDGAGSSTTVVYVDSTASSNAVAELQHQQQNTQRQGGSLDRCGNGTDASNVVAVNGEAIEPGCDGVNELHLSQSTAAGAGTSMLVSPSGISPHQQLMAGHLAQHNVPMSLDGVDVVVDGVVNNDGAGNHTAVGIEPQYSGIIEGVSVVHPYQQQEAISNIENEIDRPNSSSPHAAGNEANDDEDRNGTVEPNDGNVEDCLCSLNAMVICQQCGAFCHDDCVSATKLCVSCVVR
uniref:DEUBAD domain-containing protein n=1 Tax=Anopheles culicifacies TaxID=139723 RepID=A0A182MGG8_9DIPT